ncbi:MAG TPA: hypothetical protein VEX65_10070 [Flavisolibacter sp.]|jgi:hypothetical protein|nr:hypothetical protein [Flavisolibacter sp.]
MIAEPKSFKCVISIRRIERDPDVSDKYLLSGEIISAEEGAKDNSFFRIGRFITGFTFNLPADISEESEVKADVEFMGDPFVQNYHLRNVELNC